MANIPLVQIPNAPQTGSTAVPLPVGAIRTPDVELMGMIDDASYMAVGRAYENLGNAGQQAANVLGDFSLSMARATDEANLAAADRIKTDMLSKFDAEVATKPESEWNAIWENNYAPKLRDQVTSLRMTTRDGLNRRDIWLANTENAVKAQVFTSANKAIVQRGKQEITNYIDRAMGEGRWEDAMAGYKRGAAAGFWTPEDAEAGMIKIEEEQKVSTMTQAIQQNPAQWRKELAKYQKEGKNPHKLRPEQVLQFRRMAEGNHAQLLDDLNNQMLNRLETESAAITNDQIEEFYNRPDVDAPRELINKMKEYRDFKYADTPEGQAEQATRFSDLWQKIFSYDAEKDISMADPDTHKREYQRLISEIVTTAPEGQRKPFMDTLDKMVSDANQGVKSRADEITKGLTDLTGKLASWGQLGDDGGWKEVTKDGKTERVPKDPAMQLQVQTKRLEITNDIRAMLRENPDLTEEQAMERFKGILENRLDGGALFMQQPDEEGWWDTFKSFIPAAGAAALPAPLQAPASMMFRGAKAPASIRHNNAGAMWYVGGWQKKFGAEFGQNLNDGLGQGNQIASFPTPVHGAAALMYQLDRPIYRNSSVRQAIAKWSGGNNVSSYLSVLKSAGFSPNQKVADIMSSPDQAIAFAKAMARHEAGTDYPMNDDQWQQAFAMFQQA
ncbi:MAG: hypothetical protein EBR82_11605 [Caulobacteraceae bacterium]|nr:hypothetical protein [Caulobacteraceae bacterium]